MVVGSVKYESALYATLPRGGVIARFGVGHDGIDKRKATDAGLLCTNTPGVLDASVAEHTALLMLAVARRLHALTAEMTAGTGRSDPPAPNSETRPSQSLAADALARRRRASRRMGLACG